MMWKTSSQSSGGTIESAFSVPFFFEGALYPNRCSRARFDEDEKFQILCAIYRKLNATINPNTFTNALAQTCWTMKENKGTLTTA